jgi:hypothetical protein
VTTLVEMVDQAGEVVLRLRAMNLIRTRPAGAG